MSWATVRAGMATRLKTINGLVVYESVPHQISDRTVALIVPDEPFLQPAAHRGKVAMFIRVIAMCMRATAQEAQEALDGLIWPSGTGSIQAAVQADKTLSGTVDDVQFIRVGGYGQNPEETSRWQADVTFRALVTA